MTTNKLKKAALMAGIGAVSMLPLKSSAQAPVQDKQEKKIEISVNPDKIRNDIQLLQVDSTNIARHRFVAVEYHKDMQQQIKNFSKLEQTLRNLQKESGLPPEALSKIEQAISYLKEIRTLNVDMDTYITKFITHGPAQNIETQNLNDTNNKLAELRMLQKLVDNNTK